MTRTISQDKRLDALEIPLVALAEALANALVHREYASQPSPVYVDIFYDRIEICSPGSPPEPMTMEDLQEEHKSHPRNPQIARIFYLYGYVEKAGSGIQRMKNAVKNARLRPIEFELGKDKTFRVIFYRPQQMLVTQSGYPFINRRRVLVTGATLAILMSAGTATWFVTQHGTQTVPTPKPASLQALYNQAIGTTPLLDSPLSGLDKFGWDHGKQANTSCTFADGAYHAQANPGYFGPCYAAATNFSDFLLQVQMTMVSGHSGGLVFRATDTNDNAYQFRMSIDGIYILNKYVANNGNPVITPLLSGTSATIVKGMNQHNRIAVLAQGNTIALYINKKYVGVVSDGTYQQGQIGVYVDSDPSGTVEGAFSNLQVWKIPVNHTQG